MLLVMMMFVSPSTARAQGNDPGNGSAVTSYGDVNEDGVVNILDVILVNQYLIGEKQLSDQGRINADVDNNKTIDTTDALNILKRVVEMIPQDGFIYGEMNTVNGHIIIGESNPVNVGGSGGDAGTGVAASETLYGDVNVDGSVDNLDVTLINKYLLGTAELSEQGKKNADVDANGTIDTTDSLNILKCCQELIEQSEFPIK